MEPWQLAGWELFVEWGLAEENRELVDFVFDRWLTEFAQYPDNGERECVAVPGSPFEDYITFIDGTNVGIKCRILADQHRVQVLRVQRITDL